MAAATTGDANWKPLVDMLSDQMPEADRIAVYQAVRQAGILPEDAALFLFGHTTRGFTSEEPDSDRHVDLLLRRHGLDETVELHARDERGTTGATNGAASSSTAPGRGPGNQPACERDHRLRDGLEGHFTFRKSSADSVEI